MNQVSHEVVESQKVRSDLQKWKAISVAALGAVGLGLSGTQAPQADLVLCIIPLICAYIDLQCRHLSLRIQVIGHYRSNARQAITDPDESFLKAYEIFAAEAGHAGAFSLESAALVISSVLLSLGLLVLPAFLDPKLLPHGNVIIVSGALGLFFNLAVEGAFQVTRGRIKQLEVVGQEKA